MLRAFFISAVKRGKHFKARHSRPFHLTLIQLNPLERRLEYFAICNVNYGQQRELEPEARTIFIDTPSLHEWKAFGLFVHKFYWRKQRNNNLTFEKGIRKREQTV